MSRLHGLNIEDRCCNDGQKTDAGNPCSIVMQQTTTSKQLATFLHMGYSLCDTPATDELRNFAVPPQFCSSAS